jgi:LmbE family N-acetylglucosaminyl deacetylase
MGENLHFMESFLNPRPVPLNVCSIPRNARLLVLAPHPDDFDEIGLTLRLFRDNGNPIHLSVVSLSPSGVQDGFCTPSTDEAKARVREKEQRQSCEFFGLTEDRLEFLQLSEDEEGHIIEDPGNYNQVRQSLLEIKPDLVLLPHGNDPNTGHRRTSKIFMSIASQRPFPMAALFYRDPKTIKMRYDFYTPFGDEEAKWKATLLRFHASQQKRNLNLRGKGFDERVLETNRLIALECPGDQKFAEAFECVVWA